jgi:hypothetical protein
MKAVQKKSYLWVGSENRTVTSPSSSQFDVTVQTPYRNVIAVDVVKAVIDYKAPNVAPNTYTSIVLNDRVENPYIETVEAGGYDSITEVLAHMFPAESGFEVTTGTDASGDFFAYVTTTAGYTMAPNLRSLKLNNEEIRAYLGLNDELLIPTLGELPGPNPHTPILTWTFFQYQPDEPYSGSLEEDAIVSVNDVAREELEWDFPNDVRHSTPVSVKEALQNVLPKYNVRLVDDALVLELPFAATFTPTKAEDHHMLVPNAEFQAILGVGGEELVPVVDDAAAVIRWTFPRTVKLPKAPPFLFIQSQELGNTATTAAGDLNFFRVLIGKPTGADPEFLIDENMRVDFITRPPRDMNNIDITVLLPDKTTLDNGGGSVGLLLQIVQTI